MQVSIKEKGTAISITFFYIPELNIVTIQSKLLNIDITGVSAGEVIIADRLLDCLFPNDFGTKSPNPRTKYQLEELQLQINDLISILTEKQIGKPYAWAQRACGLDFVNVASSSQSTSSNLCETTVPNIIKQIRARLQSRVKLYKQIHSLESGKTDGPGKSDDKFPVRISGNLVQWSTISYEEYSVCPAAAKFVDNMFEESPDLFYRAIITRGSAKLECYIRVSVNYPDESPLWALSLNWNGKHDSTNDSSIKVSEANIFLCLLLKAISFNP